MCTCTARLIPEFTALFPESPIPLNQGLYLKSSYEGPYSLRHLPYLSLGFCLCHSFGGHRLRGGCSAGCRRCPGRVPASSPCRGFCEFFEVENRKKWLLFQGGSWTKPMAALPPSNWRRRGSQFAVPSRFPPELQIRAAGSTSMQGEGDTLKPSAEAGAMPEAVAAICIGEHRHAESRMPSGGYWRRVLCRNHSEQTGQTKCRRHQLICCGLRSLEMPELCPLPRADQRMSAWQSPRTRATSGFESPEVLAAHG